MARFQFLPISPLWLLQTTERDEGFSTLTIVLIVLFMLLITIVAGLLLRPRPPHSTPPFESGDETGWTPWSDQDIETTRLRVRRPLRPRRNLPPATLPAPPAWLRGVGLADNLLALPRAQATIQQLLDATEKGQTAEGFALYSEAYLARFRQAYGLDEDMFAALLNPAATQEGPPIQLASLTDFESRSEGAIEVTAHYAQPPGAEILAERYRLVRDDAGRWLIDDIRPAE
jgi:hypothetical protein